MTIAASRVSGYETKFPSSAAAMAGMTSSVRFVTSSPAIGTISIPAVAASMPPSAQVRTAKTSGDQPSDDAAR